MQKHIGISVLAFGVALVAGPANAQLLNLGGDGSVLDLGSGDQPTVNVDLGSDTGVTIDLGGDPDVTVDVNSDANGDISVDLPISNGDSGGDFGIDLNQGDDDDDVVVGLPGDSDAYVDLFGKGSSTTRYLVDLGDDDIDAVVDIDTGQDGVIVDLFGSGEDQPLALDIDPLDNSLGDASQDRDGLLGAEVIADLFGEGGVVELVDLGDLALPVIGSGDSPAAPNLLGSDLSLPDINLPFIAPTGGEVVGDGDDGLDGRDGDDGDTTVVVVDNPPPVVPGDVRDPDAPVVTLADNDPRTTKLTTTTVVNRATASTRIAAANTKCFTPDAGQIAHLVSSRTYSPGVTSTWRTARTVSIVPVQLCPEARVKVSQVAYADGNMAIMREGIAASPAIRQKLQGSGLAADNVLAVDSKDGTLKVYVY